MRKRMARTGDGSDWNVKSKADNPNGTANVYFDDRYLISDDDRNRVIVINNKKIDWLIDVELSYN